MKKEQVKEQIKKNAVVIAAGTGIIVGGCFALFLRQKRIDFLNHRALKGVDITVLPVNDRKSVGIRLNNLDTGEYLGIGLTKESATRIANYIYQIVKDDTDGIEAIIESGAPDAMSIVKF